MSAHPRSKIEAVAFFFCSAESKTNKDCDNRAQEIDNPGGAEFNPHLSLKQSDGSILRPSFLGVGTYSNQKRCFK